MKLVLKYPVNPYIKNQDFGDSMACCEDNGLPVTQRKIVTKIGATCPPGYTELYPVLMMKGHTGMDMHAPDGIPCYYTAPDGVVEEIQTEPERGLGLGIITQDKFLFEGGEYHAKTRYWHLKGFKVAKGDIVKTGQLIGWCDNTGLSSGSHLHYELKPVLKNSKGKWYNVFQDNGYYGAVNPELYFNGEYAFQESIPPFTRSIYYGQWSKDVLNLQKLLSKLGYFDVEPTGYYGNLTKQAVYKFQQKYVATDTLGSVAVWYNKGFAVLKLTREALNRLI